MAPELDLLSVRVHDLIHAALARPVLMAVLPADAVRLLRAMGAYWDRAGDAELQTLYDLLPMFAQEKETDMAFQCPPQHAQACQAAGLDVQKLAAAAGMSDAQAMAFDWSKLAQFVKVLLPILIQFLQPNPANPNLTP